MTVKKNRSEGPSRVRHPAIVTVWRWRVVAAAEAVPLQWSLPVGDAVLDGLARTAWTLRGSGKLPVCLHGPDDPGERNWMHDHAFILPEDADGDGMIDCIKVCARMGLDPAALRLLVATDRVTLSNGVWLELMLERAGGLETAGRAGPAVEWISRTAYVPPNDRPRFDPKDAARQLKYEIGKRGLGSKLVAPPRLVPSLDLGGCKLSGRDFHLERDADDPLPEGAEPCFFRIEFERPVTGPLAFGWACHSGLGQFVPAE